MVTEHDKELVLLSLTILTWLVHDQSISSIPLCMYLLIIIIENLMSSYVIVQLKFKNCMAKRYNCVLDIQNKF